MKCFHRRTNDIKILKIMHELTEPTKTPQAEISGRKILRPKPLESVPQFFLPLPSPPLQIKLGGPIAVNCSWIKIRRPYFSILIFIKPSTQLIDRFFDILFYLWIFLSPLEIGFIVMLCHSCQVRFWLDQVNKYVTILAPSINQLGNHFR